MALGCSCGGTAYRPIAWRPGRGAPGRKRNISHNEHDNELNPRNNTRGFIFWLNLPWAFVASPLTYPRRYAPSKKVCFRVRRRGLRQILHKNPATVYRYFLEKNYFKLQNPATVYRYFLEKNYFKLRNPAHAYRCCSFSRIPPRYRARSDSITPSFAPSLALNLTQKILLDKSKKKTIIECQTKNDKEQTIWKPQKHLHLLNC